MSERGGGCGASPRAPLDPPGSPPGSPRAPSAPPGRGEPAQGRKSRDEAFLLPGWGGDTRSPSPPRSCPRWGGEKREEKIKIKTLKKK